MTDEPETDDGLDEAVKTQRERRALWEREGERSMAANFAMIGALGWTIVTPTLAGVFAGRWIDHRFAMGIFWTLSLMVLGLTIGCVLAWNRMHHD